MPTTFERAPAHVTNMMLDVMRQYHSELFDVGLSVDVLFAHADPDSDEPAVKAHGYPAAAVVRKIGLKDRVKGHGDAEIVIDGDQFHEWSEREINALLDHELTHLDIVRDKKTGFPKRDDIGRPKLSIRLHDRQFGWFDIVAKRWKDDSFEVKQAKEMIEDWEFCQLYLPGFKPADLGTLNRKKLEESKAADARNGETTSIVDKPSKDLGWFNSNQHHFEYESNP